MQAVFDEREEGWTPAEWALRFVWDEPRVGIALSGMSSMEQLDENLRIAGVAEPGSLSDDQLEVYERARTAMRAKVRADCSSCRYCMPCPAGIDIPGVLAALNASSVWDDDNAFLCGYSSLKGKASLCEECGQCEEMCPQGLEIPALMKEAAGVFGG
jgi:predicted aldo/keto reductase-like oxidoreductase